MIQAPLGQLKKNVFKAFLETVVLVKLKISSTSSGYEIIKYCHTKFGISTSAITIYGILSRLEEEGLVTAELQSRIKLYSLTKRGERELNQVRNSLNEIQDFIKTLLDVEDTTTKQS